MSDTVIRVENLSKKYIIGHQKQERYTALRDVLANGARSLGSQVLKPFGKRTSDTDPGEFWALKDVSFEIKQGDRVGIIGRNGAGKSTLLKVLSRITEPTTGRVSIKGRVASLLEVGTGFHPELTGRENIYLNGAILGMSKFEIKRKFDEIVAFAEVEKFLDTPVKRYSSGMYVRLAFAVAAHLEPEILVVDEVLAVGDSQFQNKCLGKMEDVGREGRTIIFVSHNMATVRKLCQQGLLLYSGTVLHKGPIVECVNNYLSRNTERSDSIISHVVKTNAAIAITSIRINNTDKDSLEISPNIQELKIEIKGVISKPMKLDIEVKICDLYETVLAFFSPGHERGHNTTYQTGSFCLVRSLELPRIMRGDYYLHLYVRDPDIAGWTDIPYAVQLTSEGILTASGQIFDYYKGSGWIFLSET